MAEGMIEIIEPRLPTISRGIMPDIIKSEYKWVKICDSREDACALPSQISNVTNELQIYGDKILPKDVKKYDRNFLEVQASSIINRNVRYFYQSYADRMWLAKLKIRYICKNRNAMKIQCLFRVYKSKKALKMLCRDNVIKLRVSAVVTIQKAFRDWQKRKKTSIKI